MRALDDCLSAVSGIILTDPPDGELVLEALRESGGWAVSLHDDATYAAQAALARHEGLFAEPAAAVTWAAVEADLREGRLTGGESIACILTGIGFKDSAAIERMTADANLPMIDAAQILDVGD